MFLESLEITGFKSFARKTTLSFPLNITAIVGPNGSGKSNIADALRWVLGEQSAKLLRGKKTQDVIFSGSQKKQRLNAASVSIVLNNEDQVMPLAFSQIKITRKIYRDGESEYLINDAKTTLQEIHYLLAKAHIGQKSYSIIGQGLIDQFLLASPRERKSFFDEASGVKPYQIKRQQSLQRLEKALENLKQAQTVIKELIPRLHLLSKQVEKLKQKEVLTQRLQQTQYQYYGYQYIHLQKKQEGFDTTLLSLQQERTILKEKMAQWQHTLTQLEQKETDSQALKRLQQQYESLFTKKHALKQELLDVTHRISMIKNTPNISTNKLSQTEIITSIKDLYLKSKEIEKELPQLYDMDLMKELISSFFKRLHVLVQKIKGDVQIQKVSIPDELIIKENTLKQDISHVETQIDQTQKDMNSLYKESDHKRQELIQSQHHLQQAQKDFSLIQQKISNTEIDKTRVLTKLEDIKQEMLRDMGEIPSFDEKKIQESQDSNAIYQEMKHVSRQLDIIGAIDPKTQTEFDEIKSRHDFLQEQIDDLHKTILSLQEIIQKLDGQIHDQFLSSFDKINEFFTHYFKILFSGGNAQLELIHTKEDLSQANGVSETTSVTDILKTSSLDKEIQGVDIMAKPPGKNITNIQMLSGGEKALVSIALICAIISTNPSPFVVLDEVDAALDESNSIKFAHILQELSSKTQCIVITHNRSTMEKAQVLYGVTMGDDGISNMISLDFEQAKKTVIANRA